MAHQKGGIRCTIITPDRRVLDTQVSSVVIPAHDGQIGILRGRAPLVCRLGIGVLKLQSAPGEAERRYYIDGGFAQVRDDNVTVLTQAAMEPGQVDRAAAEAALRSAIEMKIPDEAAYVARNSAIARAKTQLMLTPGQ